MVIAATMAPIVRIATVNIYTSDRLAKKEHFDK